MAQQILYVWQNKNLNASENFAGTFSAHLNKELLSQSVDGLDAEALLKKQDIILFICQLVPGKNLRKQVKTYLQIFREVRVPYLFIKEDSIQGSQIDHILAPVNYLPEEKEKASWCNNLGRLLNSKVTLLQPKDHGSRAAKNVSVIRNILEKTNVPVEVIQGKKPSDKIEMEALKSIPPTQFHSSLLMISASRAYSLDDIFFGPKELHIILKAQFPVLVINPRDDIYELCGD